LSSTTSKLTINASKISNISNAKIPLLVGRIGSGVRVNVSFYNEPSNKRTSAYESITTLLMMMMMMVVVMVFMMMMYTEHG